MSKPKVLVVLVVLCQTKIFYYIASSFFYFSFSFLIRFYYITQHNNTMLKTKTQICSGTHLIIMSSYLIIKLGFVHVYIDISIKDIYNSKADLFI